MTAIVVCVLLLTTDHENGQSLLAVKKKLFSWAGMVVFEIRLLLEPLVHKMSLLTIGYWLLAGYNFLFWEIFHYGKIEQYLPKTLRGKTNYRLGDIVRKSEIH